MTATLIGASAVALVASIQWFRSFPETGATERDIVGYWKATPSWTAATLDTIEIFLEEEVDADVCLVGRNDGGVVPSTLFYNVRGNRLLPIAVNGHEGSSLRFGIDRNGDLLFRNGWSTTRYRRVAAR